MAELDISWTPATDNVGVVEYQIYYKGAYDEVWLSHGTTPFPNTTYSVDGLVYRELYNAKITATDAAGNISNDSNIVTGTAYGDPPIPSPFVWDPPNMNAGQSDNPSLLQLPLLGGDLDDSAPEPLPADFVCKVDGTPVTIDLLVQFGTPTNFIRLSLATASITNTSVVTISYTGVAGREVRDTLGNIALDLVDAPLVNVMP